MNLNFLRAIPLVRRFRYNYLKNWIEQHPQSDVISHIKGGLKMKLRIEDWVQQNIFLHGYYEENETNYLLNKSKNVNTFIDIGANVGYFSLLTSANICKNNGKIFAFEPITRTFERLQENIFLNNITCINNYKIAISDSNTSLEINIGNDQNWGMSSINKHDQLSSLSETVKCQTLDSFCEEHHITAIDLVKIDVEGAEFKVLKGMINVIQLYKPEILIEIIDTHLNQQGVNSSDIFKYLWSKGYRSYEIGNKGTLKEITKTGTYKGLVCFK